MSRANLEECASRLGLPDLVLRRSRMVLQEWMDIKIYPNPDFQNDSLWSTCAIYTAVIECRTEMESPSEQGPVITLLQILKVAQVNVKSFLDCMNYIGREYEHSKAMKDGLLATKRKYCITIGIYRTYERLMDDIFQTSEERQTSPLKKDAVVTSNSSLQQHRRRVCWCLFLVAKETMLPKNTELMPPLQLMLCCIHYIAKQSPLFMLKETFRTAKSTDVANGFTNSSMLSEINVACARGTGINKDGLLSELLTAEASLFEPFLQNIPQGKLNQAADGLPELGYLERKYKAIYEKVADIDEMAFLDNDPVLMPIREPRPRAASPDTTSGDIRQPVPQTPVRTSMRTVQSLKTVLANATDKPSASIVALLNEYGDNLASVTNERVDGLKEVFIREYLSVRGQPSKVIAQTRFRLGVRLYYREMENFIKKEKARQVDSSSIKNLLNGDIFHKCLLACSLEVVKVTYEFLASPGQASSINNGGLDFPWILSIFNLHAYDFCKVIETFIREETQLSEQAVKHLKNAEEFILESEAWKEGSPLFDALRARGLLTDSRNPDVGDISSSSRVSNSQLWQSPGPSRQQGGQSSHSTREATPPPKLSQSPPVVTRQMGHCPGSSVVASSGNPQGKDVFLTAFHMKMQKLGYKRLKVMCAALKISGELENFMWTCLDHCLMERPGLLENHHLDQLIMCCIFAICKVNNRDILFKDIASVYSKMPHAVSSTYKHVRLNDGTYGHIILFYNSVFIAALKDYILKFQPHGQNPQLSPVPNTSSSTPNQQRSYRLTSNLIISPLKASPFKSRGQPSLSGSPAQMTPRTKLLIVTGEEFNSVKLREFTKSFALEAKRKNERQEQSKSRKKLILGPEDSSCEVGSTTEGSKQSTRQVSGESSTLSTLPGTSAASIMMSSKQEASKRPATELASSTSDVSVIEKRTKMHTKGHQGSMATSLPAKYYFDKRHLFVECLKKNFKSLSETMTVIPWDKTCRWKSTDLFVCCGLVLKNTKSDISVKNIEDPCKLKYTEIFSHDKLKSETPIIIQGGPGTGKTMLLAQLAFDWSIGKINDVDILIVLPLTFVEDKMLVQAIRELYIPANIPISEKDIEAVLASESEAICLLFDEQDECSTRGRMRAKKSSEVIKVVNKVNYPNCKVVVTTRSGFTEDLPEYSLLKIGQFGKPGRNSYIEKLSPGNIKKQEKLKHIIEDNSFLLDICGIPLLFTLIIYNIESMCFLGDNQFDKVAPLMKNMVETLGSSSILEHKAWPKSEELDLGELAFDGLCNGQEQLTWQKDFIEKRVSNLKHWIDCQVLVVEKDIAFRARGKEYQDIGECYGRSEREEMEQMTKKGGSDTGDEKNVKETSQSLAQAESQQQEEESQEGEKQSNQAALVVRFLHKVIQEWFAATYLCSIMRNFTDEDQFHEYIISKLHHISPKDCHYVLRFMCYLHPPSCHAIMNYLLTGYCSEDGDIPSYVMDCICLCFAEHNDIKGPDMKTTVTEVCKEVITIDFQDGRLLQQAKSSLLQYASNSGVIIEELRLTNAIAAVGVTSLTLNSGTMLGPLHTLQVIEVSEWDGLLLQNDFANILKVLCTGNCIKSILCVFPSQPPEIVDNSTIENASRKNLEVKWDNRHDVWTLDPRKRIFVPVFGTGMKPSKIEVKKGDDIMSHEHMLLPGTSTSSLGKWPIKRQLSEINSDSEDEAAAKRLKMKWNPKLRRKDKNEALIDVSQGGFVSAEEGTNITEVTQPIKTEPDFIGEDFREVSTPVSLSGSSRPSTSTSLKEEPLKLPLQDFSATYDIPKKRTKVDLSRKDESLVEEKQDEKLGGASLHAEAFIDKNGGTLFLCDADISLHVPAGALTHGCMIRLTVPLDSKDASSYSEVLPRLTPLMICEPDIHFHLPVKLTLPHCAVIKDPKNHTVTVQFGHKSNVTKEMTWVSEDVQYSLSEHYCSVFLNHFTGVDVGITSPEEKILRVIPYIKLGQSNNQVLTVWLCNDLESDFQRVMQSEEKNEGLPLDSYDTFRLRCVSENKVKVCLEALEGSNWHPHEKETTVGVKRLSISNKSKCNFRLLSDGNDDESYMYLLLRVTQTVCDEKTETTFALRKRICDLKMPVKFRKPFSGNKQTGHLFPTDSKESLRPYTAVVYMDPVKRVNDDVIITVWLSPFNSSTEMFQGLQEEQELQYRHQVDTENSFSVVDDKPAVVTKTQFLNGQWLLSPEEMKIETERIRFGSRAKFQFIGKRNNTNETEYIELQVETFQVGEEKIRFITDVELNQLLYEVRQRNIEKRKASENEDHSNPSNEGAKSYKSQINLLASTSSTRELGGAYSSQLTADISPLGSHYQPVLRSQSNDDAMKLTIRYLSRKLTSEWESVGRELGLEDGDLYRIKSDNSGTQEAIRGMLVYWTKKKGSQATYSNLIKSLEMAERKDLAETVKNLEDLLDA